MAEIQNVINRVKADVAAVREDLSAANLAGDLSKARSLVVSALHKVDGVIGHLASVVADEVEEIAHNKPVVDEDDKEAK